MKMMKKMLFTISILCLFSCEEEGCPEGSFEWTDAQGDFIDCIDINVQNLDLKKEADIFIKVKKNSNLQNKLDLLK